MFSFLNYMYINPLWRVFFNKDEIKDYNSNVKIFGILLHEIVYGYKISFQQF